jgi:hypothetical protein
VLCDAPFVVDESYPRLPADFPEQLAVLVSAARRGDAVELDETKARASPSR